MSSSVWGVRRNPEEDVANLSEIMSEQLAIDLSSSQAPLHSNPCLESPGDEETDDLAIARALQAQFDREYNESIRREERALNGGSKVSVSLNNFKSDQDGELLDYADSDEESLLSDDGDFFAKEHMPRCGYKRNEHGEIVTKHDAEISALNNSRRVLESFPPGISTGEDVRVTNAVYNEMKRFTVKENRKRASKVKDKEDKATEGQHTDPKTRLILYKMVNNGLLDAVRGIVSTGKEAVILHGDGGTEEDVEVPSEVAIKVFKTTLNEFKNREKYIKDDYRFRDRFSKQNPRKVVTLWAEKEMHNLGRMRRAGINVPTVVTLKKHVLVMSFIGAEGRPAPKLKEAILSSSDWKKCYEETVDTMRTLYNDCHLVHGDLSEYNILWHAKRPVFIDVSQAVEPTHPHALEFLYRDVLNVTDFFSTRLTPVMSPEELFEEVTGLSLDPDHDIEHQLLKYQESAETHGGDCFESQWNKSLTHGDGSEPISIPSGRPPGSSSSKSPSASGNRGSSYGSEKSLPSMTELELKAFKDSVINVTTSSSPPLPSSPAKSSPKVSFAP